MYPPIGAHVSTAGGLFNAIDNGTKIGANCIQIFGANPRQWYANIPTKEELSLFQAKKIESSVGQVFLHAPYLINLSAPEDDIWYKSIKNLSLHFQIANLLQAKGIIFHTGSGKDRDKEWAIERATSALKKILSEVDGSCYLVIENSASVKKVGANAAEIKAILDGLGSERVKVCLDTAHAFESGMIGEFNEKNIAELFCNWDKVVGLENIVALHINDSKTLFNSQNDRHENIGKGYIGIEGFRTLAKEQRSHQMAWILEVPGFEGQGPDKQNIAILRSLFP